MFAGNCIVDGTTYKVRFLLLLNLVKSYLFLAVFATIRSGNTGIREISCAWHSYCIFSMLDLSSYLSWEDPISIACTVLCTKCRYILSNLLEHVHMQMISMSRTSRSTTHSEVVSGRLKCRQDRCITDGYRLHLHVSFMLTSVFLLM